MNLILQRKNPEIEVSQAEAKSHPPRFDNDNAPPRVMLRDYPIVARHWFGLNVEVGV
ncbi:hypothetical protein [Ruegeria sp. EL01]|jgi:hypothetical protein|uniref:hypothetical protein n=1 Tax=Ruegeria sp. EL01 TaxID=2107578 RepID=UPI0013C4AE91|nr:hypothetical protein [Ruegeria sp. EL01]